MSDKPSPPSCLPAPEQIVLAAAAIAIAVTDGRSISEIESLVNLLTLVKDNVQSVLAQRLIVKREQPRLDINL